MSASETQQLCKKLGDLHATSTAAFGGMPEELNVYIAALARNTMQVERLCLVPSPLLVVAPAQMYMSLPATMPYYPSTTIGGGAFPRTPDPRSISEEKSTDASFEAAG